MIGYILGYLAVWLIIGIGGYIYHVVDKRKDQR